MLRRLSDTQLALHFNPDERCALKFRFCKRAPILLTSGQTLSQRKVFRHLRQPCLALHFQEDQNFSANYIASSATFAHS